MSSPAQPDWMVRRAHWVLFALHVPFIAMAPINVAGGIPTATGYLGLALPLALVIGALQLRHSFA